MSATNFFLQETATNGYATVLIKIALSERKNIFLTRSVLVTKLAIVCQTATQLITLFIIFLTK